MEVREAVPQDIDAIMDVINAAFRKAESFFIERDRVNIEYMQPLLQKGKFLVADDEVRIVGCVYLELRGDRAYLGLLSVDPQSQGSGLGSTLMNAAENFCRNAGCRFMDLRIVNLRTENEAFYKRRGYVEIGTEPFPAELTTKVPCHFVNMSKPLT
jgi:N-acetylglutamate synthase-like GNAT family acetyltransferase